MGQLLHRSTKRIVPLGPEAVAGRASGHPVLLTDPAASTHHASLSWSGERWEARDLGSTNGTSVDGRPLPPREKAPLARGTCLRFGSDEEVWELVDDGPPAAAARRLSDGEVRVAQDGLLALPSDEEVVVSVLLTAPGRWLVEVEDGTRRPARYGDRIEVAGETWELTVPAASPSASTYKASGGVQLAHATLRLLVSPGDKHVRLEIVEGAAVCKIRDRACFNLLLLLARKRLDDAQAGLPEDERGWIHVIDALAPLGKKEETAINVNVLRARRALSAAGVLDAEGIIERRSREMRIGARRLEISGS